MSDNASTPPWIDADSVIAEAQRRIGQVLDEPLPLLDRLCSDLVTLGPRLHFLGKQRIRQRLAEALGLRLRLAEAALAHPGIVDTPLPPAVFIVAPFRSGTTFLHRLLAQDTRWRWVRPWEAMYAPRRAVDPQGTGADERVALLSADLAHLYRRAPSLQRLHGVAPDAAEECFPFLESTALSSSFLFLAPVFGYLEALARVDAAGWGRAYAVYRQHLQVLQRLHPAERWLLKSPVHLEQLAALRLVFPEAVFVHLHRDPAATLLSLCRLIDAHWRLSMRTVEPAEVGRMAQHWIARASVRAAHFRRSAQAGPQLDLSFDALRRDPLGAAHCVMQAAGLAGDGEGERRMAVFAASAAAATAAPDDGTGLATFGLTPAQAHAAMADYSAFAPSSPGAKP